MAKIKITESRFAALMNDGSTQSNKKKNKKPDQKQPKKQQQSLKPGQGHKQNKKKAEPEPEQENQSSQRSHSQNSESPDEVSVNENTNNGEQWNQWRSKDKEYTEDAYEKDLQEALLLSKLEIEQQKQLKKMHKSAENDKSEESNRSKKRKKKAMSLEQFNSSTDHEVTESKNEPEEHSVPSTKIAPNKANDKYFNKVDDDVNKILRKEKLQEDYKKHYAHESVMASKYQEELQKRDEEIVEFQTKYQALEDEHKKVKKRNKQLCFILAEGEMKDKTEVLLQVEELSQVKDELTDQVASLTAELEKERSKVHSLKTELDKIKGGKAGR